jgi:1-aminocyclopropane-1-carboxylate deaminase
VKPPSLIEPLNWPELAGQNSSADALRLDKIHPIISGNKGFKLTEHLRLAAASPHTSVITFGGAWSNHLVATAYATKQAGLPSIGIVRGEQPFALAATLQEAASYDMQLQFISRRQYAEKDEPHFLQTLTDRYPGAYIIPEGGGGLPGIKGSEAILCKTDAASYTHILCALGTGTTWLGLVRAASPEQTVIGVPVLKGIDNISAVDHQKWLTPEQTKRARLLTGYHFGGYARHPQSLLDFMNRLHDETKIPTDIVYTGKLFYAVRDSLVHHVFPARSRLLVIHSGGLQGNRSLPTGSLHF